MHIYNVKIRPIAFYVFIFICSSSIFNVYYRSMHLTVKKQTSDVKTSIYSVKATKIHYFIDPVKHILLWTNRKAVPFVYLEDGNKVFINKKCKWTNCYVTGNKNYLESYTDFDVIALNGPQIPFTDAHSFQWPTRRSLHQKYVYANIESASNYPITNDQLNGVFNWTWTYKLDSDEVWGYFVVRDTNNTVIAPSPNVKWITIENMDSNINETLKNTLQNKKRAAVWFASNCNTIGGREEYVRLLQQYLRKYKMDVDVYGTCGPRQCPKQIQESCFKMIRKYYYFYLAFENAISEDYVTEKVVNALKNDAVPIVYGGANYSRFLPDGIYLDAQKLNPMKLAKTMFDIIENPEEYAKFFRWRNHYSFHFRHESSETDEYCKFCANLNNKTLMSTYSVKDDLQSWWMKGLSANGIGLNSKSPK